MKTGRDVSDAAKDLKVKKVRPDESNGDFVVQDHAGTTVLLGVVFLDFCLKKNSLADQREEMMMEKKNMEMKWLFENLNTQLVAHLMRQYADKKKKKA